ncbi:MAG: DNA internalization-related competence protein ComEC/Rec2 [Propionibacteriales bacterium]|nr:DNA internalization-related competence protein ComEC/Rec2 [Propionibacteriales bacterium]
MSAVEPARADSADFRLLPAAVAVWVAAAAAAGVPVPHALLASAGLLSGGLCLVRRRPVAAAPMVLAAAALAAAALRVAGTHVGPVGAWAEERAIVSAEAEILTEPRPRSGPYGDYVVLRARLDEVTGRGRTYHVRTPVLVIADPRWQDAVTGQVVRMSGRLDASRDRDIAAVIIARGPPTTVREPSWPIRVANRLRAGLRESVSGLPSEERALVPALVVGDDVGMPEQLAADFRATGLTHLLAVSGANLTIVLGFVMLVGRWCGVRARGLVVFGALGVLGFVVLARFEPSVLRAAAMGVVALAGLSAGGRRQGIRALCAAIVLLVLVDPWLARSVAFLLSVLATSGILLLVPPWRDAMSRWMPRPVAEALAVPLAAQIVVTPVIAAISGQVSLVAVLANLLAAPAVAPATVLGVMATLASVVNADFAAWCGWSAGRAAWWIVAVAERGAAMPAAAMPWPVSTATLLGLGAVCLGLVFVLPWLLARRVWTVAVALAGALVVVQPAGGVGWPPSGWVMVACDVGQGDALVLNAGENAAVIVDTGPDATAVDRCLDRLDVRRVRLVMLSHLHADHAGGLAGVADGRPIAEIEIGPLTEPAGRFRSLVRWAESHRVPVRESTYGARRRAGDVSWTVLSPPDVEGGIPSAGEASGDENNASIVLLAQVRGARLLLTGDIEPEAQTTLLHSSADLRADVLKVPHHGSVNQDADFLAAVDADVAIVSAGEENDYGHPSGLTLDLLQKEGALTYRTDLDGDIAVVSRSGELAVATRG